MADFNSRGSILPVASVSKRLKASLSYSTSSSVSPGLSIFFLAAVLAIGFAPLIYESNLNKIFKLICLSAEIFKFHFNSEKSKHKFFYHLYSVALTF